MRSAAAPVAVCRSVWRASNLCTMAPYACPARRNCCARAWRMAARRSTSSESSLSEKSSARLLPPTQVLPGSDCLVSRIFCDSLSARDLSSREYAAW